MPPTVWIVEDDADYRATLELMLGPAATQAFESVEDTLAWLGTAAPPRPPDVVLLDVNLPGMTGVEGLDRLKALLPGSRFLMLTIRDDAGTVYAALRAGASGYLLKSVDAAGIEAAVQAAHAGGMLMPAPIARLVLALFEPAHAASDYGLSPRERDVLSEMTRGYTQKQTAARLFISPSTVNSHVQRVYEKLHVCTASAAVSKALREHLLGERA